MTESMEFWPEIQEFITNHYIMTAIWIIILGYLIWLQINIIVDGIKSVDANKMATLVNHNGAGVIDIRKAEDFRNGHIPGSISVAVSEIEKKNFAAIEKFKNNGIIIVGKTFDDPEAYNCAKLLKKEGYKDTFTLEGGILDWNSRGMPTTKR